MTTTLTPDAAVERLAGGAVIGLPTDTVYGLAASLAHPGAIDALFRLKQRPTSVALPVLIEGVEQALALGVAWPTAARQLAARYWPGPLTIIVAVPEALATLVGATSSIGFRIPDDPMVLSVLRQSGPLAVTSANLHGEPPCTSAHDVASRFSAEPNFSGVLDGGERRGDVSSVVDLSLDHWELKREGAITRAELAALLD